MEKAFNYSTVPEEIKQRIRAELKRLNYTYVLASKLSPLDSDKHLWMVIGRGGYREGYATWLFNSSIGGIGNGRYDMDFPIALADMANRINYRG